MNSRNTSYLLAVCALALSLSACNSEEESPLNSDDGSIEETTNEPPSSDNTSDETDNEQNDSNGSDDSDDANQNDEDNSNNDEDTGGDSDSNPPSDGTNPDSEEGTIPEEEEPMPDPNQPANPVWIGDFEVNDLTEQWTNLLLERGLSIIDDGTGNKVGKVNITSSDLWPGNNLNRVELQHQPTPDRVADGAETYFGWSFYLPETLEPTDHLIGYWESNNTFQQILSLRVNGEKLFLTTNRPDFKIVWEGEGLVTAGRWHRAVFHVKWNSDPNLGEVSLWFNGEKVVEGAKAQTFEGNSAFIQIGMLRQPTLEIEENMLLDGAYEGNAYTDVISRFLTTPETP
ncbi:MAG: heparin lyase I family protein [Pseudomonadota bacterium]